MTIARAAPRQAGLTGPAFFIPIRASSAPRAPRSVTGARRRPVSRAFLPRPAPRAMIRRSNGSEKVKQRRYPSSVPRNLLRGAVVGRRHHTRVFRRPSLPQRFRTAMGARPAGGELQLPVGPRSVGLGRLRRLCRRRYLPVVQQHGDQFAPCLSAVDLQRREFLCGEPADPGLLGGLRLSGVRDCEGLRADHPRDGAPPLWCSCRSCIPPRMP